MELTSALRGLWRRFRGLPGWAQLVIAVVLGVMVVSPFRSGDQQPVAASGPAPAAVTTTTVPATTAVLAPTTAVPAPTTTTLAAGVPAQGDDSAVVRVIDGDTIEVTGGTRVRLIGVDTPLI